MKHEHKLTPTQVQFFLEIKEGMKKFRPDYLMALGRVKELETVGAQLETAQQQQLQLIVNDLPKTTGYILSEDRTMLVGELIESPKTPPSPPLAGQPVNGAVHPHEN